MQDGAGGLNGWLADPGKPFRLPVFIPYDRRSLVLVGANGYGKSRLLTAIAAPATPRVYARLPARLVPYLTVARSRLESGTRTAAPTDLRKLFEEGESANPRGDEHQWWSDHLGRSSLRWIVRWRGDQTPATLSAVAADHLLSEPLAVIQAAPPHVADSTERWTMPDAQSTDSLATITEDGFRSWADDILAASGGRYHVSANALIAIDQTAQSVSLLSLAARFTQELATRAVARLALLVGLTVELRCLPAERFSWQFKVDDEWIPLELASRAISRWSALTARETLKELGRYTAHAVATDTIADLKAVLAGDLDGELLPPGAPGPFASRTSWIALDEPELHLFASESHRLGEVLADHGHAGRTLIVTHSLDLAAQFVGNADFLMFDGPGRFTIDQPSDGLANLLQRFAKSGPGILASTRVLYVEGNFDIEVLSLLYGELLARHNILLSPMHGVKGAKLAATSVWQRMMTTPFGIMFDSLSRENVDRQWAAVRSKVATAGREAAKSSLRKRINALKGSSAGVPHEDIELLWLFMAVVEGNLEDRLYLVMHGLSDILQVIHPSVFGIEAPDWRAAGYDGTVSFKKFISAKTGVALSDGKQCQRMIDAFVAAGRPVDRESAINLSGALLEFAAT
jgi:hypothetical protein